MNGGRERELGGGRGRRRERVRKRERGGNVGKEGKEGMRKRERE